MSSATSPSASREILADFEDKPRFQLELALLHDLADAEQKLHALFQSRAAPRFESLQRRLHRRLDFGGASLVMYSNHLGRLRRIDRTVGVAGLDATSADDQVVFAAEFGTHLIEGGLHSAQILRVRPVDHGLVAELAHGRHGGAVFGAVGLARRMGKR